MCAAERDPEAMLPARVEATLFAALDGEPDTGVASQLHATLRTLLATGAPTRPAHYLAVCTAVIFSSAQPPVAAAAPDLTVPGKTPLPGARLFSNANLSQCHTHQMKRPRSLLVPLTATCRRGLTCILEMLLFISQNGGICTTILCCHHALFVT